MKRSQNDTDGRSGFALFAVISFLLLLAAISISFFSSARDYALISRNHAQTSRDEAVAGGILLLAAQRYQEWTSTKNAIPGAVSCQLEGRYSNSDVSFQNHAGLIDLNAASEDLLQLGFVATGASIDDAQRLAAIVNAYRAVNLTGTPHEASDEVLGGLKHGRFESISELLDFPLPARMTAAILSEIFTVHSLSGTVDEQSLSPVLASTLRTATRDALPFFVPGSNRTPAFTVSVALLARSGVLINASAIYFPGGADGIVRRNGPITISRTAATPWAMRGRQIPCNRFFDQGALSLLSELAT